MSEFTARVSLAVTAHVRNESEFDSLLVYPASFERLLTNGETGYQCTKVFAVAGVVVPGGLSFDLEAEGFSSVKVFLLQNTTDPATTPGVVVTVTGEGPDAWGPRYASVSSGQVDFCTNDYEGWPVTSSVKDIVIGGNVGAAYKFILFGN
jgi:hypothetical protein